MNYDDYGPVGFANCYVCGSEFEEGVEEGYTACMNCSCTSQDESRITACYLLKDHAGDHLFTAPSEDEPSEEEVAEALASIGKAVRDVE